MRKPFKKGLFLYPSFFALPVVPLALAASCGSDETPVVDTTTLSALKVNAESTHDNVTWPALAPNAGIAEYRFYFSEAAKTLDEVKNLQPTDWVKELPKTLNYDAEKRFVWAKITPTEKYTIANPYLDLTNSSQIKQVRSSIDAAPSFAGVNLASVELDVVSSTNYKITEVANLPIGAQILYDVASEVGLTKSALITYLLAHELFDPATSEINAYLAPADATKYVLRDNKRNKIDAVRISAVLPTIATEDKTLIESIVAEATSTHNDVKWTLPAAPYSQDIRGVVYSLKDYASAADATEALPADWSASLPSSVGYDSTTRRLWVKVLPVRGKFFENAVFDITAASGIKTIKSLVDALPNFETFSLAAVKLEITAQLDYFLKDVAAPAGTKIIYQVEGEVDRNKAEYEAWIKANAPTREKLATTKVLLVVTDSAKYLINDSKQVIMQIVDVTYVVYKDVTELLADKAKLDLIKVKSASNNTDVQWDGAAVALSDQLASLSYLSGDYATLEKAKAAASDLWVSALPTTVDYDRMKRHLWVKVAPSSKAVITNPYYDLTTSSAIQTVKSQVESSPDFATLDLKSVTLEGTRYKPVLNETSLNKPLGTTIVYSYKTLTNLSSAQLRRELIADSETMTVEIAQTIKLSLALDPATVQFYLLNTTKEAAITADGNGDPTRAFVPGEFLPIIPEATISTYLDSLKVVSGDADAVVWTTGFNAGNTITLPEHVDSIEYVVGDYPAQTDAEAAYATQKSLTMPSSVFWDHTKRFAWAFVKPSAGYRLKDSIEIFNLSVSSGLINLFKNFPDLFLNGVLVRFANDIFPTVSRFNGVIKNPTDKDKIFMDLGDKKLSNAFYYSFEIVAVGRNTDYKSLNEMPDFLVEYDFDTLEKVKQGINDGKLKISLEVKLPLDRYRVLGRDNLGAFRLTSDHFQS